MNDLTVGIDIGGTDVDLGDLEDRRLGLGMKSLDRRGTERAASEHCDCQ